MSNLHQLISRVNGASSFPQERKCATANFLKEN